MLRQLSTCLGISGNGSTAAVSSAPHPNQDLISSLSVPIDHPNIIRNLFKFQSKRILIICHNVDLHKYTGNTYYELDQSR